MIFSGGMSYEASKSPCLTIMHGKSVTVLEMEHQIIDFIVLCNNVFSYGNYKISNTVVSKQTVLGLLEVAFNYRTSLRQLLWGNIFSLTQGMERD